MSGKIDLGAGPADKVRGLCVIGYLLIGALLASALAYWTPWVDHKTAALKLAGQDLGEFVKFLPATQQGTASVPRQLFYLPPFVCGISAVLISANRQWPLPRWLRIGMMASVPLILTGLLPPVWGRPSELFGSEFRWQGIAFTVGILVLLGHGLFARIPLRILGATLGLLSLLALCPTEWAFWASQPAICAAYDTPSIHLGWGNWLFGAGWIVSLACAVWLLLQRDRRDDEHTSKQAKASQGL